MAEVKVPSMNEGDVKKALSDRNTEEDTINYLIFCSSNIFYGVGAEYVETILHETAITYLPMMPSHVSGIINLRGQLVPIIDFRVLLGRMSGEENCIIVLDIEGTQIGILADSVDQMIGIEKSTILPVPSSQHEQKLVSGMCTLPGRKGTLMVLDCTRLIHE